MSVRAISAGDAHGLAGISYRQLDHWARQGWVTPSVDQGEGRSGRRLYSLDDVIRLSLLRHLAQSKVNPAVAGPAVAACEIPSGDIRFVWGPVGNKEHVGLQAVRADDALEAIQSPGAWVVFDPTPLRRQAAVPVEPEAREVRSA
jgi:DNA-binding transcriptional MerR regulator